MKHQKKKIQIEKMTVQKLTHSHLAKVWGGNSNFQGGPITKPSVLKPTISG